MVSDRILARGVERAVRSIGFAEPLLWVNNHAFALLATRTGWRSLYDVTDDWLIASCTDRERLRRMRDEAMLMAHASEVVVCSPTLAATRGRYRPVTLLTNAVDIDWVRAPAARPNDMPPGPVACYVGTLHEDRLDIGLCLDLGARLTGKGSLVLVGPDILSVESRQHLASRDNIVVLGARPHSSIPGYLQHADVLVVPHRRTPFTESLDPIKAYEYRAVGRPVVATPVAGFRDVGAPVVVAAGSHFVEAVAAAISSHLTPPELLSAPGGLPTWQTQAKLMQDILLRMAG
jgi:glycosyltransferase involved in cell wall biosynthesis